MQNMDFFFLLCAVEHSWMKTQYIWTTLPCDGNDIMLKFSSRQDNANCMQINDMINVQI